MISEIGLWLYDLLAGSRNIAKRRWFSYQSPPIAPQLKTDGLLRCRTFFDAQVNDARLVLQRRCLWRRKAGARCFDFRRVTQIDRSVHPARVFFQDERTGESGVLQASFLVNASGPWANQTAKMISENAFRYVRPTRGSHIVVPRCPRKKRGPRDH